RAHRRSRDEHRRGRGVPGDWANRGPEPMTTERIVAPTNGVAHGAPIRVIFVCTGNSARSQMAEALLRRDGGAAFEVVSAGVSPRGVHPMTIEALHKLGIDITRARPTTGRGS